MIEAALSWDTAGWVLLTIVAFLFVLTVVIFFHELGHFLVARWCGVKVAAFSIGFGPEIFGFVDRHGTRWRVAALPLGGYVKFIDDENVASVATGNAAPPQADDGTFHGKPLWKRAAIVAAGPIANFLLAFVIFGAIFTIGGERVTVARVDEVLPDGAAAKSGFKPGDLVTEIDGVRIESFADMQRIVSSSADRELTFVVDRAGGPVTIKATPDRKDQTDRFCNKFRIGMIGIRQSTRPEDLTVIEYSPPGAVWRGMQESWFIVTRSLGYIGDIVMGREDADQLGGPIKIAVVSGQVASLGFDRLIYLIAVMSVSIGLFNLFPIPILDGGNLLFYAIEAIRGHPLSERAQAFGFRVGLALLGMLMVFVMTNDLITEVGKKCAG